MQKLTKKELFLTAFVLAIISIRLNYFGIYTYFTPRPQKLIEIVLATVVVFILFLFKNFKDESRPAKLGIGTLSLFALFSSYRIIYFYTANITEIPLSFALAFIGAFCAIFFLSFLFFKAIFETDSKAAVLSLVLMATLSVPLYNANAVSSYIAGASLIGITLLTFVNTEKLITFLKPCAITLLALCLLNGSFILLKNVNLPNHKLALNQNKNFKAAKTPNRDIYIFILDAYAGQRTLSYLGFDNSNFFNALRDRDFQVYKNMESNYNQTVVSIPSFLNADYIENIPYEKTAQAVSNAMLFKTAKKAGYKIYYINSWTSSFTITNGVIDEAYNITMSATEATTKLFIGKTLLKPNLKHTRSSKIFKETIALEKKLINKKGQKRLIFAHFLMPHPPYMFDENGNSIPSDKAYDIPRKKNNSELINKESYLEFLKYTNKTVLGFLDEIFAQNREKPIIIIMGDHGARLIEYPWNSKDNEYEFKNYYKYYFNTFIAYYNPDVEPKKDKTAPKSHVNFSRKFFNEVFGTSLKPAPDKHFYIYTPAKGFKKTGRIEAKY